MRNHCINTFDLIWNECRQNLRYLSGEEWWNGVSDDFCIFADMIRRKFLQTDKMSVLVLDEADRLLEMGFKDELMSIVNQCKNPNRKTLMFSATLN